MTSALNPARVEPNATHQLFKHRLLIDDAENLEVLAEKLGVITYRTRSTLNLLLETLMNQSDTDEEWQIVSLLELIMGEVKDIEAIQRHIAYTAKNKAGNDLAILERGEQ